MFLVFVDDILVAHSDRDEAVFQQVLQGLFDKYSMRQVDLTKNRFLGIRITQSLEEGYVFLDQEQYAREILDTFNLSEGRIFKVPSNGSLLPLYDCDQGLSFPYRSCLGSIRYLVTCTRPDLAISLNLLERHNQFPGEAHVLGAKAILHYLRGTLSAGLLYKRDPSFKLFRVTAMSDSTWADDPYDSCSTSGFIVKLNHGSLLHWGSRKQKSVKIPATPPALSSPEAEFVAASDCSRQIVWFSGLLTELQVMDTSVTPLLEMDNQGAIQLSSTTAFLEKTKHIKIKFHHVRALHLSGELEVRYIQTDLNTADCMTKPLDSVKFNRHVFGHQGFAHIMERARPQHALALLQQLGDRTELFANRLSKFQAAAM